MKVIDARHCAMSMAFIFASGVQALAQTGGPAPPAPNQAANATVPASESKPGAPSVSTPAANPAPGGTPALVVDQQTMETVTGKKVRSATGEDLGRLIDVMVDANGQVRAAIIDFGGVLGVGSRKLAVEWSALDFKQTAKSGNIILTMTRDQIRTAPEYRPGEPTVVLQRPKSPDAAPAPVPSHR